MTKTNGTRSVEELILENSLAGYWDWNIQENTEYLSPTFKTMFGYQDNEMENSPESWQKIIFQEDLPVVLGNFKKHADTKGEHPFDQIVRYHHKSGSTVWVRCKGEVIEWKDETPIRMVGCHVDLTAEKKLEEELDEISKINKIALSRAKVGIWLFDVVNNDLTWSDEMFDLYGQKREDFSHAYDAWTTSLHAEDLERGKKEIELALSGEGEFDTTFRVITNTGSTRHIRAKAVVERDNNGNPIRMIGTNWDVTDVFKAQADLEAEKIKFESAFEYSAIGMAMVSLEGRWMKVNKEVCRIMGYEEQELLSMTFQDITHADDLHLGLTSMRAILNGEKDVIRFEKRYIHKNGNVINALLASSVVKNQFGKPDYMISQIEDITERVNAQRKLEQTLELTTRQNDRLLNFAHIVSHNLRSHTGNLGMMFSFLEEENDPKEQELLLNNCREIAKTLHSTVEHLSEVVKLQSNQNLEIEELNLLDYVNKTLTTLQADLKNSDAKVENNIKPSVNVHFNSAYLDSTVLNLLSNAIKYKSSERPLEIILDSSNAENEIQFSVSDNGLGIDLDRHGEKLFGLHKTFHKHKDARGVGLFLTRSQVEAYGGTISVESQPNKGSTFKIALPYEN